LQNLPRLPVANWGGWENVPQLAATCTADDASLRERDPPAQGTCAAKAAALRRLARRAQKERTNGLKRL
jgi:hypothetical protein